MGTTATATTTASTNVSELWKTPARLTHALACFDQDVAEIQGAHVVGSPSRIFAMPQAA